MEVGFGISKLEFSLNPKPLNPRPQGSRDLGSGGWRDED